jgi:hypothetical protein
MLGQGKGIPSCRIARVAGTRKCHPVVSYGIYRGAGRDLSDGGRVATFRGSRGTRDDKTKNG